MAHRIIGIKIKDVLIKDGRLESDAKGMIAKLPLNKQIAIKKSKKIRVKKGPR
jgi:hypothetical protein